MFKATIVATAVALTLSTTALAQADSTASASDVDQRLDAMEGKVENLDNKLDQILTLLAAEKANAQPATAAETKPAVEATTEQAETITAPESELEALAELEAISANEPKNQGLLMDVYVLDNVGESLPELPKGFPVATLEHKNGANFTFGDHLEDKDINKLAFNQNIGINYYGYINIKEPGNYVLSQYYEANKAIEGYRSNSRCKTTVSLEGKNLLSIDEYTGYGATNSEQTMLRLTSGFKKLNVWLTCISDYHDLRKVEDAFRGTKVNISIKGPSDRKLTVVPQSTLFHM
ncbi:hypothetical protein [Motilimonas sp. KMU-193]|uniref:hypothetical protein n=1 Tax=Motilimonas sp. KMU-193 TaxID=3388668 RepID=UPI00396B052D